MSRLGKLPVAIPAGVKVSVNGGEICVEGPKGKLTQKVSNNVSLKVEGSNIEVTRQNDSKDAKAAHGLYRNLINNMIIGVSSGFSKNLIVNGVGFRAEVQGKLLVMNLGYSSDFIAVIPEGLTVTADAQGKISRYDYDQEVARRAELSEQDKPETQAEKTEDTAAEEKNEEQANIFTQIKLYFKPYLVVIGLRRSE